MQVQFVRKFVNRSALNSKGERLGVIKAVAVNMEIGKIAYAVLAFGGFPNRTKLFAVPWEIMRFSTHDRRFVFDIPKKLLQTSAGYNTLQEVVDHEDFQWLGGVYPYFSNKAELDKKRKLQLEKDLAEARTRKEEIMKQVPPIA